MAACVLKIKINPKAYSWGAIFINNLCLHPIYLATVIVNEKKIVDSSEWYRLYSSDWLLG
jgi:hypothetical protein